MVGNRQKMACFDQPPTSSPARDLKLLRAAQKNAVGWRLVLGFSGNWLFFQKNLIFLAIFWSKIALFNFEIPKMAQKHLFFGGNIENSCFIHLSWPSELAGWCKTSRNGNFRVFEFWVVLATFHPLGCSVSGNSQKTVRKQSENSKKTVRKQSENSQKTVRKTVRKQSENSEKNRQKTVRKTVRKQWENRKKTVIS
jgi:gas vesicle protein